MNKVHRGRNQNRSKVYALFAAQVAVGIMPVLLLLAFVFLQLYEKKIIALIFIILMFLCNAAFFILSRRYAVINSGIHGERSLFKAVKKLRGTNYVFCNLPVRYKRGRSELDMMIIMHTGVLIIEVKNHSGTITGSWKDEKWIQRKYYRDGKVTRQEMDNPIKQTRRQRDIVKSILNAAGENVWIDTVLFFSSPNAKLRLELRENDNVVSSSKELLKFIQNYKHGETLSLTHMQRIAQIMKNAEP